MQQNVQNFVPVTAWFISQTRRNEDTLDAEKSPTSLAKYTYSHAWSVTRPQPEGFDRVSVISMDHSPYHESLPEGVVEDAFFNRFILVLNAVDGWDPLKGTDSCECQHEQQQIDTGGKLAVVKQCMLTILQIQHP